MATTVDAVCEETRQRMAKAVESLKKEFARVRTGRATPSLLDGITIDYYGTATPLNQVANISIPEARMMVIQPWEKTNISPIEKAIQAAGLGLNPQNDGNLIRLPIPPLSEDRRKELCKNCRKMSEEGKVGIRNVRRDGNEKLKEMEKKKEITEDVDKKAQERIQKLTDEWIKNVDSQLAIKEKEIMEV